MKMSAVKSSFSFIIVYAFLIFESKNQYCIFFNTAQRQVSLIDSQIDKYSIPEAADGKHTSFNRLAVEVHSSSFAVKVYVHSASII